MAEDKKTLDEGMQTEPAKQRRQKDKSVSSLDRIILQAMGENRSVGRSDDPAKESYPQLWDWMSRIYVGRDRIKKPATLTLTLEPDGIVAKLVDRDMCVSVQVSCAHMANIFDQIENALCNGNLPVTS